MEYCAFDFEYAQCFVWYQRKLCSPEGGLRIRTQVLLIKVCGEPFFMQVEAKKFDLRQRRAFVLSLYIYASLEALLACPACTKCSMWKIDHGECT